MAVLDVAVQHDNSNHARRARRARPLSASFIVSTTLKSPFAAPAIQGSGLGGPALQQLLGDVLTSRDGTEVPLLAVTGPGKVLGLLFALWCPTLLLQLRDIYDSLKSSSHPLAEHFEIVWISQDTDESKYKEHLSMMPWLAVPFASLPRLRDRLLERYQPAGNPALVIIDGSSSELINRDGLQAMMQDPCCEDLPWRPTPIREVLAGPLVNRRGEALASGAALQGKAVLLFFSSYTADGFVAARLAKAVAALRAKGQQLEVVWVSVGGFEGDFKRGLASQPWLAVPFADKPRRRALAQALPIDALPALAVLSASASAEGQGCVRCGPAAELIPKLDELVATALAQPSSCSSPYASPYASPHAPRVSPLYAPDGGAGGGGDGAATAGLGNAAGRRSVRFSPGPDKIIPGKAGGGKGSSGRGGGRSFAGLLASCFRRQASHAVL